MGSSFQVYSVKLCRIRGILCGFNPLKKVFYIFFASPLLSCDKLQLPLSPPPSAQLVLKHPPLSILILAVADTSNAQGPALHATPPRKRAPYDFGAWRGDHCKGEIGIVLQGIQERVFSWQRAFFPQVPGKFIVE